MSVKIEILYNNLPKLSAEAHGRAHTAVDKTVHKLDEIVKGSMSPNGPSSPGQPPAIDTGNLVNSLQIDWEHDLLALYGPEADYGVHLEYGTRRMAARPYMRPAAEKVRPGFLEAMKQIVKD